MRSRHAYASRRQGHLVHRKPFRPTDLARRGRWHVPAPSVSPFFEHNGRPLKSYLRTRRLSEAAHRLADCGHTGRGTRRRLRHEAFTRAFRAQFGVTPEMLRASRDLTGLTLQEPLRTTAIARTDIPSPRFETSAPSRSPASRSTSTTGKAPPFPRSGRSIPTTVDAAFRTWLPVSGRKVGTFPDVFELYGEDFDPDTGRGKVEIWLPLAD